MLFLLSAVFLIHLFMKSPFGNTIRVANSLDPDQARRIVGPVLGPNSLQRLAADDNCRQELR